MKTALCLSGQPRRVKECFPYILENIILPNSPCDIFIHAWFDGRLAGERWSPSNVTKIDHGAVRALSELYNPISMLIEQQKEFDTSCFDPENTLDGGGQWRIDATHSMFYSTLRCNRLKIDHERECGFAYDVVGRTRTDFKIETKIKYTDHNLDAINVRPETATTLISTIRLTAGRAQFENGMSMSPERLDTRPARDREGCINDHFAFGSSKNIDLYSNCFNHLDEIVNQDGNVFRPELILGKHLERSSLEVNFVEMISKIYR